MEHQPRFVTRAGRPDRFTKIGRSFAGPGQKVLSGPSASVVFAKITCTNYRLGPAGRRGKGIGGRHEAVPRGFSPASPPHQIFRANARCDPRNNPGDTWQATLVGSRSTLTAGLDLRCCKYMVGATGIEPVTPTMST